jgi:hypothetical protein
LLRVATLAGRDVLASDIDHDPHPVTTRDAVEVPGLAPFEDAEFRRLQPAGARIVPFPGVI